MRRRTRLVLALAAAFAVGGLAALAWPWAYELWLETQRLDSGGELTPARAGYDVRRYELAVTLDPPRRRIAGENVATVVALAPLAELVLDLDRRLAVAAVEVDGRPARFRHRRGELRVALAPAWTPGERHRVRVAYAGRPKVAAQPPWIDGFVWARTPAGAPWIAVVVQGDGADDWWPVKDHPSDRPEEGVEIALTVPRGLVGLANGRRLDSATTATAPGPPAGGSPTRSTTTWSPSPPRPTSRSSSAIAAPTARSTCR
jgi:aminopeptidase N